MMTLRPSVQMRFFFLNWVSVSETVSRVEPIHDRFTQDQVRRMIEKREVVQGISFLPGSA